MSKLGHNQAASGVHSNTQHVKLDVRKQKKNEWQRHLIYLKNAYIFINENNQNEAISNVFDSTVAHEDLRVLSPGLNYKWRQPHVYKYHMRDIKVTWAARGWRQGWKENQTCFNLRQCKDLHWPRREEDSGNNVGIVLLNCVHLLPSHFAIDHSINKRICWKF